MAEFGIQATQLSEPQGRGAVPVRPVETPNIGPSPILNSLEGIADIFARGLGNKRKEDAERLANSVIGQYAEEQKTINEGIVSGQLDAARGGAMSRRLYTKYAASYPQYIKEIKEAASGFKDFSEMGEAERVAKDEREARRNNISAAEREGFVFYPGMSKDTENAQLEAHKSSVRARVALEDAVKRNTEVRSQTEFERRSYEYDLKNKSFQLVNDIASSNLQAFQSLASDIGKQVQSGQMDPLRAQTLIGERMTNIKAALQSAAMTNPELAAPYRTLFDEMNVVAQKLIDPKQSTETLKNQYENLILKAKLFAVQSSPRVLASVAANDLWSNNPYVALQTSQAAIEGFSLMSSVPVGSTTPVPQVVGTETEAEILTQLKSGLEGVLSGKMAKPEIAKVQASNSLNHILTQTGAVLDTGVDPKNLKGLAAFFASPAYGQAVKQGMVDAQAQGAAKKTFQMLYTPAVEKGVQQALEAPIYSDSYNRINSKFEGKPVSEFVNVQFTGSGIAFSPKDVAGLSPEDKAAQRDAVRQLNGVAKAVTQLIQLGAHMEGNTDYAKTWEDNKHFFMPQIFKKEEEEKPMGSVKTEAGMREAVKLTPEEQAREDARELSDSNIEELRKEISNAKSPAIKAILEEELNKILKRKGG